MPHVNHIGHGTTEREKKSNSKKFTRKFEINFSKIETQSEEEVSQEEESDKNLSNKEKSFQKAKKKNTKKVNRKVLLEEKSIIFSKKSKSKQMPKSSTDIHLRGVYVQLTPSKRKQ